MCEDDISVASIFVYFLSIASYRIIFRCLHLKFLMGRISVCGMYMYGFLWAFSINSDLLVHPDKVLSS